MAVPSRVVGCRYHWPQEWLHMQRPCGRPVGVVKLSLHGLDTDQRAYSSVRDAEHSIAPIKVAGQDYSLKQICRQRLSLNGGEEKEDGAPKVGGEILFWGPNPAHDLPSLPILHKGKMTSRAVDLCKGHS